MDPDRLDRRLAGAFDASPAERRVVVRAAGDLDDAGRFAAFRGRAIEVDDVVSALREAPDGLGPVERWNWWLGALELAHGGFDAFRIERYASEEEE